MDQEKAVGPSAAKLTTVVCDDEAPALELMSDLLTETGAVSIAASCRSVRDSLEIINKGGVDLVVYDIEMPGLSGVEAYERITASPRPLVVFATAHPQYAVDAFDVDAIDYILKPVNLERVRRAVEKAIRLRRLIHERERGAPIAAPETAPADMSGVLRIRDAGKYYFIPHKDIIWVEAAGDYSLLHMTDRELTVRLPLKALEADLPRLLFVRVHRSAIVSRAHIREIRLLPKGEALISVERNVSVRTSRSYRDVVQALANER